MLVWVCFRRFDYSMKIDLYRIFMYVCKCNCTYTVHIYLFAEENILSVQNFHHEGDAGKFFHSKNFPIYTTCNPEQ